LYISVRSSYTRVLKSNPESSIIFISLRISTSTNFCFHLLNFRYEKINFCWGKPKLQTNTGYLYITFSTSYMSLPLQIYCGISAYNREVLHTKYTTYFSSPLPLRTAYNKSGRFLKRITGISCMANFPHLCIGNRRLRFLISAGESEHVEFFVLSSEFASFPCTFPLLSPRQMLHILYKLTGYFGGISYSRVF